MDKNEILEKSRTEGQDEGMVRAVEKGRRFGEVAFLTMTIVLILLKSYFGDRGSDVQALFWAFIAAASWPKYRFTGQKALLLTTILGGVCALANLAAYIIAQVK